MAGTPSSRERLNRLLDLAAQGPATRAALIDELTDLLLDWPMDYAQAMRASFEAMLEKTACEADAPARAKLLARIADRPELPLALCNAFFLDADIGARGAILARNAADCEDGNCRPADGRALVQAARTAMNGGFAKVLASSLALAPDLAARIVVDGHALAVAAKGAQLSRAAFSALAVMTGNGAGDLDQFDTIPEAGARKLLRHWRGLR